MAEERGDIGQEYRVFQEGRMSCEEHVTRIVVWKDHSVQTFDRHYTLENVL